MDLSDRLLEVLGRSPWRPKDLTELVRALLPDAAFSSVRIAQELGRLIDAEKALQTPDGTHYFVPNRQAAEALHVYLDQEGTDPVMEQALMAWRLSGHPDPTGLFKRTLLFESGER